MPKKIVYSGGLGPSSITCGGIRFEKGRPVTVEDDALAGKLLKKNHLSLAEETGADETIKSKKYAAGKESGHD